MKNKKGDPDWLAELFKKINKSKSGELNYKEFLTAAKGNSKDGKLLTALTSRIKAEQAKKK